MLVELPDERVDLLGVEPRCLRRKRDRRRGADCGNRGEEPLGLGFQSGKALLDQIERFAPGLRERIIARHVRTPADLESYNPNYVGGDIITGANTPFQSLVRPRLARGPYATGIPGVLICSAATPFGAGAHGMNGYNAAQSALRTLRR